MRTVSQGLAKKLRDAGLSILWGQTLPTLSDLLAELEARGYVWVLNSKYKINICLRKLLANNAWVDFRNDNTPEEAAGLALLYVLEKEKGGRE